MPRRARAHAEGYWYHVGNRGARKLVTFGDDADRRLFLSLLADITERFGVEVHAYCLMSNHYHLVMHCPDANLGEAMHRLGTIYTQRFNKKYELDGPLFTERFWSDPIATDDQLLAVVRYVERNPTDLVGSHRLRLYPWSSFGAVVGSRRCPTWLTSAHVLGYFGNRVDEYRTFVENDWPRRHEVRPRHPDRSPSTEPTLADIEAVVCQTTGCGRDDLSWGRKGSRAHPRLLLFLLASESGRVEAGAVAREYGLKSAASVRSAVRRARAQAQTNPAFAGQITAARALLTRSVPPQHPPTP